MSCKCGKSYAEGVDDGAWLTLMSILKFWSEAKGDTYALETFLLKLQETLKPSEKK